MNNSKFTTPLASVQWLFFIFANTIVVPISVGTSFDLTPDQIAVTLRSSLIFTGIACFLQGWIGHRYPIMEGHSGIIWGLILNLGMSASSLGMSFTQIGGGIASGILLAGIVTIILAAFNLTSVVQKIFTPMVASVYLFLLAFQLILTFFKGMLKIEDDGTLNVAVSLFSILLVLFVSFLKIKGNAFLGNFSILLGIAVGWILYLILFPGETAAKSVSPEGSIFFPLGLPNLEWGIVLIAFLGGMMNLSNTIASIQAAAKLYQDEPEPASFRRSFFLTGSYSAFASVLGLVSYAPFTSTIGFLESTQLFKRKPFLIGGAMITIMGIFPPLVSILVTLPVTVGNAVLFVAYLQLFGTALKSIQGTAFDSKTIFRIAAPLLIGVSIMNTDPAVFRDLSVYISPLLSNGLMMGLLLSILLEAFVKWE
ncbi:uracil/xanthine transporter [Metabacillus indicus]|uniref:uracil/xanthine transporter n=1 Tax=Metabacillus indicus TaxID=246786 RepID=UPI0004932A7E|nr:uracil/xanthine transporter [Metabacillus indicus]KEZ47002.1 uracil/xanthine transporter [Metabacillus indicus LMG 22858]